MASESIAVDGAIARHKHVLHFLQWFQYSLNMIIFSFA